MPENPHGVSEAIERFRSGDKSASEEIWKFAFPIVLRFAVNIMRGQPRTATDEEDVALSSLASLFRGMAERRFPSLERGEDLLRVIFTIAWRKAKDERGRAAVRYGDVAAGGNEPASLSRVAADELSPAAAAEVADEIRRLHSLFVAKDPILVQIAELLIDNFSIVEIAARVGRSQSTVKRKIERMEQILRKEWTDVPRRESH